ncbi:MAG: GAF domain-containing protein [Gammaproteobacteria bacterium]|nr:GAF domain-containing protein [Gammaproteobacteria bacterium]MBU1724624.1 GAF domain-containing protein [Gammaproteobacteria bacterium]MBU2004036.1 GAF domain-containing protein [Gammaproteobacteria bacterium]
MSAKRHPELSLRQRQVAAQKERFLTGQTVDTSLLHPGIAESWLRSANLHHLRIEQDYAPREDEYDVWQRWAASPLRQAMTPVVERIKQMVNDGGLVATLADPLGRLLWTYASEPIRASLERCNAAPGGRWDEQSVGTTSVGHALNLRRPVTVFADEHYLSLLKEWVCYSAPILHPQSGELYGVLNVGTVWERHTAVGEIAAVSMAQDIARHLPLHLPQAELEIRALGQPQVRFRGQSLHLTPRMVEILCILALNPAGLTLEACHAILYGDGQVSVSTLKAEFSHLRTLLDGCISSRVYRLLATVWADFIELWTALRQHKPEDAHRLYRGELLPDSTSSEIGEWRTCIAVTMAKYGRPGIFPDPPLTPCFRKNFA